LFEGKERLSFGISRNGTGAAPPLRTGQSIIATSFRYFAAVAERSSIRAAARTLNVAPSAINRQILMIERALGIELFERVGRTLRISEAGQILLQNVRQSQRGFEESLSAIAALRGLQRGKIAVATVESVSVSLLPDVLAAFAAQYPGIEITVNVASSQAVSAFVRAGEADIGFTFNPGSLEGLRAVYERDLPLGALVAPSHPLAKRRRVPLADCLKYPIALPMQGLSLRAILEAAIARMPEPPRAAFEANSLRLMSALALRGRCIAFQTAIGIEKELSAKSLVLIPLSDPLLPLDRFTIVEPAGRKPSLAAAALLRQIVAQLSSEPRRRSGRARLK
jgi:DNA-binding transcriptional LysR family regulator